MRVFEVGGHIRDELLGLPSSDVDLIAIASSFDELKNYVSKNSQKIFLEKPEFNLIRYLALDGSPQDITFCHSLEGDLKRRDFTINAFAREVGSSEVIDVENGLKDLKEGIIRCIVSPKETFQEDPARIIRAIRLKIKLKFDYDRELSYYMYGDHDFSELKNIDRERLRQELDKCFKTSSEKTIGEISRMNLAFSKIIFDQYWLRVEVRKN